MPLIFPFPVRVQALPSSSLCCCFISYLCLSSLNTLSPPVYRLSIFQLLSSLIFVFLPICCQSPSLLAFLSLVFFPHLPLSSFPILSSPPVSQPLFFIFLHFSLNYSSFFFSQSLLLSPISLCHPNPLPFLSAPPFSGHFPHLSRALPTPYFLLSLKS